MNLHAAARRKTRAVAPGLLLSAFCWVAAARGAERVFDLSEMPLNKPPEGFESIVAGSGKPGVWRVIEAEAPLPTSPLTTNAPTMGLKSVVAQTTEDFTDEHFPMLLLGNDTYGDFTITTKFKIVSGIVEQMAGIAFRVQDPKNYYVARVSALGNNFRFYKVVNGERGPLYGSPVNVQPGVWHEMSVSCQANRMEFSLDGNTNLIPALTDNSFSGGKIAYWTKSDSVSYFADTRIDYTPRQTVIQGLVDDAMAYYPKLLGLQVVMMMGQPPEPRMVASNDPKEVGQPGHKSDADVIGKGTIYTDKQRGFVVVFLPLCDRNGDAAASVRVKMKSFPGQTEESAIVRAMPVIKRMQERAPGNVDWTR
jgi:hypothetical protein